MKKLAITSFAAVGVSLGVLSISPSSASADELSLHPPPREAPHYEMRSTAMVASGSAVTSLGIVMVGSGAYLFSYRSDIRCSGFCIDLHLEKPAGAILMAVGAAHVIVGVPLIAVGATRKPKRDRATATLDLGLTPEGVALTGMF